MNFAPQFTFILLVLAVSTTQKFTWSDLADFTKSPTEHEIVVIEKPFAVRSVRGVVRFANHEAESLPNVLFELQGPSPDKHIRHVTTAENGRFKVSHVPPGIYKFKTTRDGFKSVFGWIELSKSATEKEIEIEMGVGN